MYTIVSQVAPCDRNSVHKWEDRASLRQFWAFVYTVVSRAAPRGGNSVHEWAMRASLRRFGAFVYTVGLRATRGARRRETGITLRHTRPWTRYASIAVKATNNALAAIRPRMMAQAAGWAKFIVQPMPKRLGRNRLASSRLR